MKLVQACFSAWKVRESYFDYHGGPVKLVPTYSSGGKVRKSRFSHRGCPM